MQAQSFALKTNDLALLKFATRAATTTSASTVHLPGQPRATRKLGVYACEKIEESLRTHQADSAVARRTPRSWPFTVRLRRRSSKMPGLQKRYPRKDKDVVETVLDSLRRLHGGKRTRRVQGESNLQAGTPSTRSTHPASGSKRASLDGGPGDKIARWQDAGLVNSATDGAPTFEKYRKSHKAARRTSR